MEPILPISLLIIGAYLSWFGTHYWKSNVKYPTDPIKSILTGGSLPATSTDTATQAELSSFITAGGSTQTPASTSTPASTGSATGQSASTNQATGKLIAAKYGWNTGTEWEDLVLLWNKESGWNNLAQNPTSTAYGIAQFLDSTWGDYGTGPKTSDPTLQITYGLMYIKGKYGDPIKAWQHEQAYNWY